MQIYGNLHISVKIPCNGKIDFPQITARPGAKKDPAQPKLCRVLLLSYVYRPISSWAGAGNFHQRLNGLVEELRLFGSGGPVDRKSVV